MKDIAVVYATKYGHTKQYAEWLKEEAGADIFAAASFTPTKALEYKAVVFAGGVYGDKIMIMDWLKKNLGQVNVNKMIIAAVSWYCNDSEEAKARLIAENYPEQFKNVVPLIVINSGIDKKKTNVMDKAQLLAAQTSINKHDVRTADDINALAIIKGYSDSTSKDNLKSLIAAVKNIIDPPKKTAQRAAEEIREALKEPPKPAAEAKPAPTAPVQPKPAAETPTPVPTPAPTVVPKPEPPKPVQPKPSAPSGDHVVTSLDDALAALSSGNVLLNKPPVHQHKPVEAEKPVEVAETTAREEAPVQPKEEPKQEAPKPVQPKPSAPMGEHVVTSLDDALAALSSGNVLLNHPPVHQHNAPEAPKAEPVKEEVKVEVPKPVKTEVEVEAPKPVQPEPVKEEVKVEESKPVQSEPVKAEVEVEVPQPVQPEPVKEEVKVEEPKPVQAEPVKEKIKVEEPKLVQPEPVKEEPKAEIPKPVHIEPKREVEENDNVLSIADDIAELTAPTPAAVPKFEAAPKPAPMPKPEMPTRPAPAPMPTPAPTAAPAPAPMPAPKPASTAPKHNSYMDLFSRKKPTAEPAPVQAAAPAPTPAPVPKPAPTAAPEPISDMLFDPIGVSAPTPAPAPKPAPAPSPAPVSSAGIDFDFDILGNESSTANRTSSRALNAVEDLAKAKAKAEAERLKNEKDREEQAARNAAAAKADNTYDIINNSIDLDVTDNGAPSNDSALFGNETEKRDIGNISMDDEAETEETADETFGDDVMFVDDYDDSELDGLTAADLLAPEQPVQQSDHKRMDFKKLQQEIEESIELNRQIRDKERTRNMRESERKALAEAEKAPKKGIKQPEDADIFFKRPGKDYYSSDSMPEIKFNRHGNGF